eukprot:6194132-Pleurochrysis_carterae.AAC.9
MRHLRCYQQAPCAFYQLHRPSGNWLDGAFFLTFVWLLVEQSRPVGGLRTYSTAEYTTSRRPERHEQGAGAPRDGQRDRKGQRRPQGKCDESGQQAETGSLVVSWSARGTDSTQDLLYCVSSKLHDPFGSFDSMHDCQYPVHDTEPQAPAPADRQHALSELIQYATAASF